MSQTPNSTPSHTAALPPLPSGLWRSVSQRPTPPKMLKGLDGLWSTLEGRVRRLVPRRSRFLRRASRVMKLAEQFRDLHIDALRAKVADVRPVFQLGRERRRDVDCAFAMLSEVAARVMQMRPHRVQIAAALALEAGCVAELATGEGKTLVATLPATVNGWRGRGCHVVTVNDYLAQRDAEWMKPIYAFCGLNVDFVTGEMPPPRRRRAYHADVTYTTNKEVTADFLRDRLAMGTMRTLPGVLMERLGRDGMSRTDQLVMRGLACAIVDEADSILIDEAVTPLIISGESPNPEQINAYAAAAEMARELVVGRHYKVNRRWHEVRLTSAGEKQVDALRDGRGGVWAGRRRSHELITQAVTARELYLRDKQYVVQDGKIVIVDEFTGRLMPDRTWRDGLHQAVEAKESLEIQPPKLTLARLSFQRFFRLYGKLAGMTGTCYESRHEMWQTYRLPVVRIPTNRPIHRRQRRDRVFRTAESRWAAVVEQIRTAHETGQPVLVGTRSVEASEHLSTLLNAAGLDHRVLNAVRHAEEAEIVKHAGEKSRITVATNMAGRGTDIKLDDDSRAAGGLMVIATERHESKRVDRQLFGRSGRQGDPGLAIAMISNEDELLRRYGRAWHRRLIALLALGRRGTRNPIVAWMVGRAQRRAEAAARHRRAAVLRTDEQLDEQLAFAMPEL